jgi:threonine dehydrogenase-like Zn-dependent dehydrogenase
MRGVYFNNGEVELRTLDKVAGEGVRVRMRCAGICGSDLRMLEMKFPLKYIVGHEIAGVLDDGTSVAVEPLSPCNECEHCRKGDYNLCKSAATTTLGIGRDGCMTDEIYVPQRSLVYLPSNVDVKDACLVEPLAVAVHGLRKAGLAQDQRVAVIGGGTIGLCTAAAAADGGRVVGLSARYEHQTAAGRRLGAVPIDGKYDLVVECTGAKDALKQAVDMCRPGGRVLLLGTYWEGVSLSMAVMLKEIVVVSSYMYSAGGAARDFDVAATLLSRHPEIARALITHRFPLSEAKQAFAVARDRKSGAIKVVLEP